MGDIAATCGCTLKSPALMVENARWSRAEQSTFQPLSASGRGVNGRGISAMPALNAFQ
jgi:hypothetical protein